MDKKALLFINGKAPKLLPNLESYDVICCTDGAFHYLEELNFPFTKLSFISGDFDSHDLKHEILQKENSEHFEVIFTPNQDKTDFEKALEILIDKGVNSVEVLGGSGGEQDHFLGNLHAAFLYKNKINIHFSDEFSRYYFIPKSFRLKNAKGRIISLMPFPLAENITTEGLHWQLNAETLSITTRIGTRNRADKDEIYISYESGDLLLFVGNSED